MQADHTQRQGPDNPTTPDHRLESDAGDIGLHTKAGKKIIAAELANHTDPIQPRGVGHHQPGTPSLGQGTIGNDQQPEQGAFRQHQKSDGGTRKPEGLENAAQYWQRFEQSWHWRKSQFKRGLIEVTVSDTELTEESEPGEDCLEIPEASDRFNDYSVLTGWGENA